MRTLNSRDVRLTLLAATAGAADAIGYLRLGQIFIANMTGNTVLLGLAVGQGHWSSVPRYGVALIGFIAGAALGAFIVGNGYRQGCWPFEVRVALAVECAVLLALAVASTLVAGPYAGGVAYAFIAWGALAMGIQTTAVRSLYVAGISTTVITSTIASVVESLVAELKASHPSSRSSSRRPNGGSADSGSESSHVGLQVAVIVAYGVAAASVAVIEGRLSTDAVWLPAGLVLLVVLGQRDAWHRIGSETS